jgi:hypothetical protein
MYSSSRDLIRYRGRLNVSSSSESMVERAVKWEANVEARYTTYVVHTLYFTS